MASTRQVRLSNAVWYDVTQKRASSSIIPNAKAARKERRARAAPVPLPDEYQNGSIISAKDAAVLNIDQDARKIYVELGAHCWRPSC